MSLKASIWALMVLLVLVGSLLRLAAVFQHSPLEVLTTDPGRWWYTATHLFDLQPIGAIDAPGYQLWLGLVVKLIGVGATAIALHNAALSIVTPWIWHRVVREITGDRDLALAGWAIFTWLPSWIAIYSYTMSETLFLPLFGMAIWLTVRTQRDDSTVSYAGAALMWALASATRVYALPFALVMLLWSGWRLPNRVAKLVSAALIFAIVALPLALRTHYLLDVWHPFGFPRMNQIYMESGKRTLRFDISRQGQNYRWRYEFGSPSLYQQPLLPFSHWQSARGGIAYFSIVEENGTADWNQALQDHRSTWRQRIRLEAENYIFFNFAPSWPDNNPDRFWDRTAIVLRWMWVPLAIIAIGFGIRYRAQIGTGAAGVFAMVTALAWILTPLLPAVMEGRYRKPVEGLVIVNLLLLVGEWNRVRTTASTV